LEFLLGLAPNLTRESIAHGSVLFWEGRCVCPEGWLELTSAAKELRLSTISESPVRKRDHTDNSAKATAKREIIRRSQGKD